MKKLTSKIVVFDMDGVLVDVSSSWQFVHEAFGATNLDNLEKYLTGEIAYLEFMRRDIKLWGKTHVNTIKKILAKAPLMKNAPLVISRLKQAGYKTAVISAGISLLAERLQDNLGLDYTFANKIVIDETGMLTGEGEEVVSLLDKSRALRTLALMEQTTPSSCAVVGDSVFDIPIFKEAGFSIAFNTRNKQVTEASDVLVEGKDLKRILPYFIKSSQ